MNCAYAAPDVRVVVSLNGRPLGGTGVAQDTLAPTWAGGPVDVGVIPAGAFLEFRAIDTDLMFDDDIGVCTVTGARRSTLRATSRRTPTGARGGSGG